MRTEPLPDEGRQRGALFEQPLRSSTGAMHIPPEKSLCSVPLVRQLFNDPRVRFAPRQVDNTWHYNGRIPAALSGFSPIRSEIYYPAQSRLAAWLAREGHDERRLNTRDLLVDEVLMATHDYLHAWSSLAIRALCPDIGFGTTPITRDNFEAMAFCLLLTEVAATVGLDYWYLSAVHLEDIVDLGTNVDTLTTSYHEDYVDEYRQFNPGLQVQSPHFFTEMCRFYATGRLLGFDRDALQRSPRTLKWLKHELAYGTHQRRYTRMWLAYLAADDIAPAQLERPVEVGEAWHARLVGGLGEALWSKVKHDRAEHLGAPIDPALLWRSRADIAPDFRLLNAEQVEVSPDDESQLQGQNLQFAIYQFLARHQFGTIDDELIELTGPLVEQGNLRLLRYLYRDQTRVAAADCGPRDLFLLN